MFRYRRILVFLSVVSLISMTVVSLSESAERQYAPDRKVDIIHVTIDVTPDFKSRTIAGTTTIRFVPIAKPLVELSLNAIDLTVTSVTSTAKIEGYTADDKLLTITFDPPVQPGTEASITVSHEAEPKKGLYFRTPEMGYRPEDAHLWSQGEMHEAPYWFPNYDYPNERFTTEVICHVPGDMVVLSNGRLVSEQTDPATGLKAVRWLQDKPQVNYLIALVAGKFKKIESNYRDIPLAFYTPSSQIGQAPNSFRNTADMMGFLEKEIGIPYPWDKYYQVVVDDFTWGGMENTTLTVLTDRTLFTDETENIRSSQELVVHEMVHQWFGDYITCKDWSHTWLNEGFATYYALLYDNYKNGHDSMLYGLYDDARNVLADRPVHKPIVYREYAYAEEQFDYRTYPKGSWVLHMLRTELGEDLYRKCIRTYAERYALTSVVTEDLSAVVEEVTGRSYDRFFDQWVYHARHPDLTVTYSWSEKEKLAKVTVRQTQKVDDNVMLFHFRTKVRFVVDGKPIDRVITIDSAGHDFYFSLENEPAIVRFDPEYGILADITFDKPENMLYAQLADTSDVIGRLLAIEALRKKNDQNTVSKLKDALTGDPFWAVRVKASDALRNIHTNEAFDALAGSLDQTDARVRLQVVTDIGGFYRPESLEATKRILKNEHNPDILYEAICNLGRYHHKDTQKILVAYLNSKSYRNRLADGAVDAIRTLDDPSYIPPLMKTLKGSEREFTSRSFGLALDTLAFIARNEDDRTEVREFIAGYVNHPKRNIRQRAIGALGTLGDPKAVSIVETFTGDDTEDTIQSAAKESLKKLREQKKVAPAEIISLRETVDEIRKENETMKKDLEDIKKRLDARGENNDNRKNE
ncbi:HEAT repeat domain-containing protein [bacterium]|nr:HEAT repeat domain-containing protein [bacterium]